MCTSNGSCKCNPGFDGEDCSISLSSSIGVCMLFVILNLLFLFCYFYLFMLVFKQSMGTSTAGSTTGHVITGSCRVSAVLTPRLYARWSMNETFYQIYGIHFQSEKSGGSKEGRRTRKEDSTSLMKKRYCSAQQRSYCGHGPEISV